YEGTNFVESSKATLMESLSNRKTIQTRLVLAIALTLRGGDSAKKGQALAETVRAFVNTLVLGRNNVEDIQTLFLAALYQHHTDNASLASRIASVAARSCLELGLHRSRSPTRNSCLFDEECADLRVFWSIYMLERKTSLCQGMPFIIQDIYIDPSLFAHPARHPCSPNSPRHPMALSESELMLSALLEGAKLSGMTWHSIQSFDQTGSASSLDKLDHLDYQIVQCALFPERSASKFNLQAHFTITSVIRAKQVKGATGNQACQRHTANAGRRKRQDPINPKLSDILQGTTAFGTYKSPIHGG
ncbi:unnamed protein product, partial [Clonostachys rosea f. rosea IK726]